jgi:DNA polymerase III epsilon subunit-like protein
VNVIFLDTETTGNRDGVDHLVQLAYRVDGGEYVNELFNPPVRISYEAMAVHHITHKHLEGKPAFDGSDHKLKLQELLKDNILVAHNAAFDMGVLRGEGVFAKKFICTFKVASRYLETDGEGKPLTSRSLQYLRYALDLDEMEANAHDALGDIIILEKLFYKELEMLKQELNTTDENQILEHMMEISSKPTLLKKIRFGKHRGKEFAELAKTERSYLEWLSNQSELDEDLKYTLNYYLKGQG